MIGSPAPDFVLRDQNNQQVRLSSVVDVSPVVLVFYPFAFTGICQGELTYVRDHLSSFPRVLAISVDSVYAHKVWAEREGYDFPLLADFWPHGAVARAYGVFNEAAGTAYRGTFVIDRDGIVRFAEMNMPGDARDQYGWRKALAEVTG